MTVFSRLWRQARVRIPATTTSSFSFPFCCHARCARHTSRWRLQSLENIYLIKGLKWNQILHLYNSQKIEFFCCSVWLMKKSRFVCGQLTTLSWLILATEKNIHPYISQLWMFIILFINTIYPAIGQIIRICFWSSSKSNQIHHGFFSFREIIFCIFTTHKKLFFFFKGFVSWQESKCQRISPKWFQVRSFTKKSH